VGSAVFVELDDGTGYVLGVRDAPALVRAVDAMLQRRARPAADAPPASTGIVFQETERVVPC
jgi:hypothetical protein